jgi:hypothetical protein
MQRRSLVLVFGLTALAGGWGCGPRKDGPTDAAPDLAIADAPAEPGAPLVCSVIEDLPFTPVPVDLMLMFDRSESMAAAFGEGTRYGVAAGMLNELVPAYDRRIRFGFQVFPSGGGCPPGYVRGCCAEPPSVTIRPAAAPAIRLALDNAAALEGNTPTAEALRLARRYFLDLNDGVSDRYVLLVTDGRPTCGIDSLLPEPPPPGKLGAACVDAAAEVDDLLAAGVRTIVLGIGSEVAPRLDGTGTLGDSNEEAVICLSELARRGGTARVDGPPYYYVATQPDALERYLRQIFGGIVPRSCAYVLDRLPADRNQVQVLFDGKQIPRSRKDGWDFDPPDDRGRIAIFGEACRRLDRFQVSRVEVKYGCPPCEDQRFCE